jgi:acyl carrier protein
MKPTKDELVDIIYQSLEEVNEQLPSDAQLRKSLDTTLVGRPGGLDSLGFVNFVALVEEKCADKYGISFPLVDRSSQENGVPKTWKIWVDLWLTAPNETALRE